MENMKQSESEELDQCIEYKTRNGLNILECENEFNKLTKPSHSKRTLVESDKDDIDNKGSSIKSNKIIMPKLSTYSNTELEKIYKCINRKKSKKLPYFDCLQK